MTPYINKTQRRFLMLWGMLFAPAAWAQMTPSELAELSLQDLMQISTEADRETPWHIGYRLRISDLKGFRRGTQDIPDQALLGPAGVDNQQFPILPNAISQQVHTLSLGYRVSRQLSLSLTLPWIRQSSDHISLVDQFENFVITSEGIGDISVGGSYSFTDNEQSRWQLSMALSLPTGSIDERGDTPRDGPGTLEILPYTMQLGSGTYDIPLSLEYSRPFAQGVWGAQLAGRVRLGNNDRNYRLGDRYSLSGWLRYHLLGWIHPGVRLDFLRTNSIRGRDESLLLNGRFPAPITNPENFGGDKLLLALTARICPEPDSSSRYFDVEVGFPVYQDLNGVQVQEDWQLGMSLGQRF